MKLNLILALDDNIAEVETCRRKIEYIIDQVDNYFQADAATDEVLKRIRYSYNDIATGLELFFDVLDDMQESLNRERRKLEELRSMTDTPTEAQEPTTEDEPTPPDVALGIATALSERLLLLTRSMVRSYNDDPRSNQTRVLVGLVQDVADQLKTEMDEAKTA